MTMLMTIRVTGVKAGDVTPWYTITGVAHTFPDGSVVIPVTFNDGGDGERTFDDPSTPITVDRT